MGFGHLKSSISTHVKPIGLGEFVTSLAKVLNIPSINHGGSGNGFQGAKIGLAISGGVDSMALALLCSQLQGVSNPGQVSKISKDAENSWKAFQGISFQAFIVDHEVREGSNKEAASVARQLESQGIPSEVLKINWPQTPPTHSPNFETEARKYRFRTLGIACKHLGLDALLLAHHQDDQAETVFMRMATGHRVMGLTGIKGDSAIPECYRLHGVHESGGIENAFNAGEESQLPSRQKWHYQGGALQLPIEKGGVRVYRPLLDFGKARLRATCEDANLKWFEDHTNKDPTLTMRNSVRHMYSSHAMPPALSKPAILELSQRCRDKAASRLATMETWLRECSIFRFETRSGMLGITFPDLSSVKDEIPAESERRHVVASLLRSVIMLVTPEEHVDLTSLNGTVRRIFSELNQEDGGPISTSVNNSTFTVAGVLFKPQVEQSPKSYLISRQIYPSDDRKQPVITYSSTDETNLNGWTPWKLWDGRFWIRIKTNDKNDTRPLSVRPLSKINLKDFVRKLANVKVHRTRLQDVLKTVAPGDVRWTLPAIVHEKQLLALPTLGFCIPGAEVEWEIRYKKIDLEGLKFVGEVA